MTPSSSSRSVLRVGWKARARCLAAALAALSLGATSASGTERPLTFGDRLQAILAPQLRVAAAPSAAKTPTALATKPETGMLVVPVLLAPGEKLLEAHADVPLHVLANCSYHGFAIAHLGVARGDLPRLQAHPTTLVTSVAAVPALQLQRAAPERELAWRQELARHVVNPEALGAYVEKAGAPAPAPTADFAPSDKPSLEGSGVEMLIVTRESLVAAFQLLADERTAAGIPTVVRSLEWIEASFPHGADRQETLRLFLRDAYVYWGVQSLLLGGDTDLIPARYAVSTYIQPPASVPTDLYYACLDGNWNADGDDLWGEAEDPFGGDPGDDADLYPEFYVGRLPVHTPAEVANYRAKLAAYLDPAHTNYQDKLLFLSEVLWPVDYTPGGTILKNGADNAERLIALNDLDTGNPPEGICPSRLTKLYEVPTGYSGAGPLSRQAAIDSMNAGFGLVTHIGHGFRYTMSLADASLTNLQAADLVNGERPFFLVMLNCTASAFDFPCLAEQFLLNPQGGAVGVLGAAREAFPDGSQLFLEAWFRGLFDNDRVSVGQALQEARLELLAGTSTDGVLRWTNFITAYLGDPTLSLWRCAPRNPVVTHATGLVPGQQQLAVQVNTAPGAVPGAMVCLWKPGDFYAVARTNASGVATLAFRAEAPGNATLTVQGAGITPFQETVPFAAGVGAILRATGTTVVTDSGSGSRGNGNGVFEAGEKAFVAVEVRNSGSAAASNVQVALSTSDPFVIIQSPFVTIPTLPAGQTTFAPPITVELKYNLPDRHHLELRSDLTIPGKSWHDQIVFDLLQVQPRVVGLIVVDPDGNGTPGAGETYTLQVQFKNYGFAQLDAATATLTSSDPDVSISDGSAVVGNVLHLGTGTGEFQLTESNVAQPNLLHLVLTSGTRTWPFDVETRRPTPPGAVTADVSLGPDRVALVWGPSAATDVIGYHVYRAPAATGPWTRMDTDVVTSAHYFGADGLQGSTQYWFAVTAVDGSGNESVRTSAVAATTNPLQNTGWPRYLQQWTSCTAVVANVDADATPEVFVGADLVYGWQHNGTEIVNGDADPSTDGVFSSLGQSFTAGLAAGDLTGDGRDEIVACSWDTHQIFVFAANGSVLPGWPRSMAVTTHGLWAAPVLADLDLNGTPEVIVLGLDSRLYVWRANGTELRDGDNNAATQGVFFLIPSSATWSRGGPVVGNVLTANAAPEIVFGTTTNRIYMLRADGSIPPGWPVTVGDDVNASPALGDVDGDGDLEVVVPAGDGFLYVLRGDGSALPGWPRPFETHWSALAPSVALHDFDADGKLEIVVAGSSGAVENGQLAIFNWQGNYLPGWPVEVHTASESSPVLGDLDGDGVVEIVFGGESGQILGFEPNGSMAKGFPIRLGAEMRSTPTITDLDGDGDTDLVVAGWDQQVYAFDFPGTYQPGLVPWGTLRANRQRTGGYYPATPTDAEPLPPLRTRLRGNVPNPFNPQTRILFDLAGPEWQHVLLCIYDPSGRKVRTLVDGALPAGPHFFDWDGRDATGRAVASGVYFTRLVAGALSSSQKMVLLR